MRAARHPGGPLASGKLPLDLLAQLLAGLPSAPEVRLGAGIGEDACAIDVPEGVLVVAADPITLTSEDSARLCVIVNANDVAVTGARPRWFTAVVLVPPGTREAVVRELFGSLQKALSALGAFLVGGHTEVTPAVNRPVVVGQMLGIAETGIVSTGGFEPGDVLLQVRPAPIEGAAVLAGAAGERLRSVEPSVLHAARSALDDPGISVVEPALLAARLGARALHDPTEGGLAGGLHEMANAAGLGITVDREAMLWFEPGLAVCTALDADPWSTLASGTLVAAFAPSTVDAALEAFARHGHPAVRIGFARGGAGVEDGEGRPIPWSEQDEVARLLSAP